MPVGTTNMEPDEYYPSIPLGGEIDDQDIPVALNFESSDRVTLMMPRIKSTSTVEIGKVFGKWRLNEIIELNGKPVAVLEQNLKKHGLFVFTSIDRIVARLKKPIGIVRSRQVNQVPNYPESYYDKLFESKDDVLAQKIIAEFGEPSYEQVVNLLPPIAYPYHYLRINGEPYRLTVEWNGLIPGCFNEQTLRSIGLSPPEEEKSFLVKMGLLGGYLPAVDLGYFDEERNIGWEEIILTHEDDALKSHVSVRIKVYEADDEKDYYFHGIPSALSQDRKSFYKSLLELKLKWDGFFSEKTEVVTPEERVNDAYKAGLILAMENFEGREWPRRPKYGSKSYAAEMHNTFPPATTSVVNCFLDWGLTREAKDIIRYYLINYVREDGTFRYYGPAPDEYGQMLDAVARCFWATRDYVWVKELFDPVQRIINHIMIEREKSKNMYPRNSIFYGLMLGILEADYYQKPLIHNYSNDTWCWKGLVEIGRVLSEVGRETRGQSILEMSSKCLCEAEEYRRDILDSMEKTFDKSSEPYFLPVIVGSKRPSNMTMDKDASYANYHLYADLLYSGFLDAEKAMAVIRFREKNGGELAGTTRFEGWLDDWPVIGYGWAFLKYDLIEKFLMLYYGHMAFHQNPGTFVAYEQVDFKVGDGKGRRIRADNCIPATLVVPHLTRLMLVFEDRESCSIWINKAAPRRWFEEGKTIIVKDAITSFGKISYKIVSRIASEGKILCELGLPDQGLQADILLRLRPPNNFRIRRVEINDEQWGEFDPKKEAVVIPRGKSGKLEIRVHYASS
ncbi:hypothetical protein KEJ17_01090 [Candidatus Bathyarchaeota archaeon]|nr:hypothetical protein [Candidatus Bathyarchaeota archaeon]